MKLAKLGMIGAVGILIIAVLGLILINSSNEEDVALPDETPTREERISAAAETIPEYIAFVAAFQAGGVYEVSNSTANEFEAEDEDNEPVEYDEEDIDLVEAQEENALNDVLDQYGFEQGEVQVSEVDDFDISNAKELGSIKPGIYVTPINASDCEYRLYRTMEDGIEQLIGSDKVSEGRLIVQINAIEPDRFYSSAGCVEWSEWSPLAEPLEVVSNGDYWTDDLVEGTWEVGLNCSWERVGDFRGGLLKDILASGNVVESIGIGGEEVGLRVRGCSEPMVLVEDSIPAELAFVEQTFEPTKEGYSRRRR